MVSRLELLSSTILAAALAGCASHDAPPAVAPSSAPAAPPPAAPAALPAGFVALTGTPFIAANVPPTATIKKDGDARSAIVFRPGVDAIVVRMREESDGATAADFEKFIHGINDQSKLTFSSKSADGRYYTVLVQSRPGTGSYQRYFQVGAVDVVCMVPTAMDADMPLVKSICESVRRP